MTRDELMTALIHALREVSGQSVLFSQALAERLGISSTDLECLDVIVLRGPVTAGELAQASGLTSGAVTGVIDRLSRAGFVKREHDTQDRRRVLVRALPAVERRVTPLSEPMARGALALLATYQDEELALLLDFLTKAFEGAASATAALRAAAPSKRRKAKRAKG